MFPSQWRQILRQRVVQSLSGTAQRGGGSFQVHGVPKHDCRSYEVEAASEIALLLETAIPDFTQSVKEHRPGQGIARLALVQSDLDTPTQLHTLQPFQNEQRALDASQFVQGIRQTVLVWICAELAQHQGGCDCVLFDRGGQPQNLIPMVAKVFDVERAADHGLGK